MRSPTSPPTLVTALQDAALTYQQAHVVKHCPTCSKPCCRLDTLVLELDWQQVMVFWQIDKSRSAFDRLLSSGKGPREIRTAGGRYFIHQKACPAYDDEGRSCRVYNQPLKPAGCSDFPVYRDGDCIIADLRCEAVNLEALLAWLGNVVGPEFRISHAADQDFPFLVTLKTRRRGEKAKRGKTPALRRD